ncbi:MAG: IPExxxVDY family protein [Flavobacteriales bacterium]|nr:IPExxxVDY family protein [Flavobacteriales bacterium]
MAKLKLDIAPDPELTIIGISSHEKDYRLCWALNKELNIELSRSVNDVMTTDGGHSAAFPLFEHSDEDEHLYITLLNNRSGAGYLLKEQKQTDYFLLVNEDAPIGSEELLARVRATPFVLTAFALDYHSLREGHKLLDRGE